MQRCFVVSCYMYEYENIQHDDKFIPLTSAGSCQTNNATHFDGIVWQYEREVSALIMESGSKSFDELDFRNDVIVGVRLQQQQRLNQIIQSLNALCPISMWNIRWWMNCCCIWNFGLIFQVPMKSRMKYYWIHISYAISNQTNVFQSI